jgi:hypothetical protein
MKVRSRAHVVDWPQQTLVFVGHPHSRRAPTKRLAAAALFVVLLACALPASAQRTFDPPSEEIVANLAAGRVVIVVAKDAILVATVENPVEPETRVPTPTILGSERAGVVLGAVEWFSPSSKQELARLDIELPHLHGQLIASGPHLQQGIEGREATDIEANGQGLLERLNAVAGGLHDKIDLPSDEPLVELIIADFLTGYGPEVWQLTYKMKQELEHGEYWNTRVVQPVCLQFWPPEKGQPRTLIEFDYPQLGAAPTLLDMLRQKDLRLEKIAASDTAMAEVSTRLLKGESNKIPAVDATQFLRAALAAVTPHDARQTMAVIGRETGVQWILAPPPEPTKPGQQKERPSDAPSLAKPSLSH